MYKNLGLHLNKYIPIPTTLQHPSKLNEPVPEVCLDLANLYHHYYMDTYGACPPNPDPTRFEHVTFLMSDDHLRFQGDGLGVSTAARRNKSSELGQAFCRWFLHEHLGVKYFAHIGEMTEGRVRKKFNGYTIERSDVGDMPDYLCSEGTGSVFLAEAKGRYTSVSFDSKEFEKWRAQFSRVRVLDNSGNAVRVKGHIVATRFATEERSRVKSAIYAEDPESEGDAPIEGDTAKSLAETVAAYHYSRLLEKLDQPLLAASLRNNVRLHEDMRLPVVLWGSALNPNSSQIYVGGYFAGPTGENVFDFVDGKIQPKRNDPLRLGIPQGTFVGVQLKIFEFLVKAARGSSFDLDFMPEVDPLDFTYSGISLLQDGSIIGPIGLFQPLAGTTY